MFTLFFGTLTVIIGVQIIALFLLAIGNLLFESIAERKQQTNNKG